MNWRSIFSWEVVPEGKRVRLLFRDGWMFNGLRQPSGLLQPAVKIDPGHMGTVVKENRGSYEVVWDDMPSYQDVFPGGSAMGGWAISKRNVEVVE